MQSLGCKSRVTKARPTKGASKAAVQYNQHMPALQDGQGSVKLDHRQVFVSRIPLRILGQHEALEPGIAVQRYAMPTEVNVHAVFTIHTLGLVS